jgi:tetratricopeptide (TPR) repeat protein
MEGFTNSDDFDRRGFELCEAGDYESALLVYKEGLELFPYTPELHSGKGHMFLYLGEFVQSLAAFRNGLILSPLDPELNKGSALALLYLNRPEEAQIHLERARPYFLDDEFTLFEFGIALYQIGQFSGAVPFFEAVTALNPKHVDAILYLGLSLHHQGGHEAERKYRTFRTARELDPDRQDICEHFAHVLFEDGKAAEALSLFESLSLDDVTDEATLERMLEAGKSQRLNRRKRWALRRRLKELRNVNRVEEFIQELHLDWEIGSSPS